MATRKITRKVRVVESNDSIFIYEWSSQDQEDYSSINKFYLTYNNINYYFDKPNGIGVGDKFEFDTDTKKLNYNGSEITTSTTGDATTRLDFVPEHKWSDTYIKIGADADNVFCSDGKTVEQKLSGLNGNYVEKSGDIMTGPLTATGLTIGTRGTGTIGVSSVAEGRENIASGEQSHAEGRTSIASGANAHAEGRSTASGFASHSEGGSTVASGDYTHAQGYGTTAQGRSQSVSGEYNIIDTYTNEPALLNTYAHIIGNGSGENARSNAHTLDWAGNAWYAGDVYVGSTSGTQQDEGSKKLATEDYVDTNGGKIDSISIDGNPQTIDVNKNVNLVGLEKTANKVTSLSNSSTHTQYPSAKAVYDEINTKISTVYKAKGTCTFAEKPALIAANEGFVYNISDNFTTTSDFVDGAGKNYIAGTNIVVINNGTTANPVYKYDVLAGVADLSNYVQKTGDTMSGGLTTPNLTIGTRGTGSATGNQSLTVGRSNTASGSQSTAIGVATQATQQAAVSYGCSYSGDKIIASGIGSLAGGYQRGTGTITASNTSAIAIGDVTYSDNSSQGGNISATGISSIASGITYTSGTITTSGASALARGHAEGSGQILASGVSSIAIGLVGSSHQLTSSGTGAIAIGNAMTGDIIASGAGAFATGHISEAKGNFSFVEGEGTTAYSLAQHVQGRYNIIDTAGSATAKGTYAHIVGNGTSTSARSNAYTLDWSGNAWFAGTVKVGSNKTPLVTAASPAFTGTPTAPDAAANISTSQIATTKHVTDKLNDKITYQDTDYTSATLAAGKIVLVYEA